MSISVTVSDDEFNSVSARVTMYDSDSNEFFASTVNADGFSNNVSSGTQIPFTAILNKTVGSATIKIEANNHYSSR